MKRTGRTLSLSGSVMFETADAVLNTGGGNEAFFQNILVDERRGYAYKVTFVSSFPNVISVGNARNNPFAVQSFSRRELLRMSQAELNLHAGRNTAVLSGSFAQDNRTIAVYGLLGERGYTESNYQNQYVIKGDAMVTQSLSLVVDMEVVGQSESATSYYIELDEYEVNDNEEILLLLNERAGDARGLSD